MRVLLSYQKIFREWILVNCRFCESANMKMFIDLGFSPPSNSYLGVYDLTKGEEFFPLRVDVCKDCWLVQTQDIAKKEIFFNEKYAYFSSISTSWLKHAQEYALKIIKALSLNSNSFVVEVASNDGYLFRNFKENAIPCLGIEPTKSTADICKSIGIPVKREFFGEYVSKKLVKK